MLGLVLDRLAALFISHFTQAEKMTTVHTHTKHSHVSDLIPLKEVGPNSQTQSELK